MRTFMAFSFNNSIGKQLSDTIVLSTTTKHYALPCLLIAISSTVNLTGFLTRNGRIDLGAVSC